MKNTCNLFLLGLFYYQVSCVWASVEGKKMDEAAIRELRINCRGIQRKVNEFCGRQIPAEIFHYTLSQMRAVGALYNLTCESGKGVQLKVLAEKLAITPAAASEMVDTLVRKGAIIRKNDPDDRRAVRLYVGEVLQERFGKCEIAMDNLTRRFLATLKPEEVEIFTSVIGKFAEFTDDPDVFHEVEL